MARPGRRARSRPQYLHAPLIIAAAATFATSLSATATMTADLTTYTPLAATLAGTGTMTAGLLTDTVTLLPSGNIGTDEPTTAVLTPPSGKSLVQFRTGYIRDVQRFTPTIDLGSEEYTEIEWSITTTSLAQVGDVLEFQVEIDGSLIPVNLVSWPVWTLSATDTTLAATFTGTATFTADLQTPLALRPKGVYAPTVFGVVKAAAGRRVGRPNALTYNAGIAEDTLGLELYAGLTGTASVTAALSTGITFNATLPGAATIAAALSTSVLMAATLDTTATLAGDLQLGSEIAASLTGTATMAAPLTTAIQFASTLAGTGTITTADLQTTTIFMAATLPGTATVTAGLTTAIEMSSSWLASGTLTADLFTVGTGFEASLTGSAFVTANLTAERAVPQNPVIVTGAARTLLTWRDNSGTGWLGVGTHSHLYVYATGILTDISPVGMAMGSSDSTLANGAYGEGAYGVGPYGTGDPSVSTLTEATVWSLDTFGQYLVGVLPTDGRIVVWEGSVAQPAQAIGTAGFPGAVDPAWLPDPATGVFVTPERFLVALGVPDQSTGLDGPRRVQWAAQESLTDWTPSAVNSAGDFVLATGGSIRAGRKTRSESLIWTDVDLWGMEYIGTTLVYQFKQLGANCGAISANAMTIVDGEAYWMSDAGFYGYNGYVQPIPCDVSDYVFSDFNKTQAAKVNCFSISQFNEIWWLYPSAASTENDRYVSYNRREGLWMTGELDRTAGVDRGVLPYPVMVGTDGIVYEHEKGFDHGDQVPYAQSGFLEIMDGDALAFITRLIPDERNVGDVEAAFEIRDWPNSTPAVWGPYPLSAPTDLRVTGREVAVRVSEVSPGDWRVGKFRLKIQPRGTR